MTAMVKKNNFFSMPLVIAYGGFLIMLIAVCYGLSYGDFFIEGAVLIDMTWGIVTLVDLYLGLFLFCFWIICREENITIALSWSVLILLLGNMLSCLYLLKVFYEARGNMKIFWLGRHINNT
jgi:hypothetical protein